MNEPGTLARRVDYRRMAIARQTIAGKVSLAALPRVLDETIDRGHAQPSVSVELAFAEDSQRLVRIAGQITATVTLRCQRCLRAYAQGVAPAVAVVVVATDAAAAQVPRADEPVIADGDTLDVLALVSDELLLALPIVARCDRRACRTCYEPAPADPGNPSADKPNPFAVLKTLKRDD